MQDSARRCTHIETYRCGDAPDCRQDQNDRSARFLLFVPGPDPMARAAWGLDTYTGVAIAFMARGDRAHTLNIVDEARARFTDAETTLLTDLVFTWARLVTSEANRP